MATPETHGMYIALNIHYTAGMWKWFSRYQQFVNHLKRRMTMAAFRRRQNSDRWHWSEGCSNYPTEKDVIITHTLPEYGSLCEECKEKEPQEAGE